MRITDNSLIKRSSSLHPVEVNGKLSVLNVKTGKYIVLNSVGTLIWNYSAEAISVREIVSRLINEFEVSADECKNSVLSYVNELKKEHMIEVL